MSPNDTADLDPQGVHDRRGRPKLERPKRVPVITSIEPSKLAQLREHAHRKKKSLGQLVDEYLEERFPS